MKTCEICGDTLESWEIRCTECAVASDMPENWYVLGVGSSLPFRVVRFVKLTSLSIIGGLAAYILGIVLVSVLARMLSDGLLYFVGFVALAVEVFIIGACITGVYWAFDQLRSDAGFFVTRSKIEFHETVKVYESLDQDAPPDVKFIDAEIKLADVRRVQVRQGWLARHLGYGDVEIFTNKSAKPEAVIYGVTKPGAFKEKLEMLVEHRPMSQPRLTQMPTRQDTVIPKQPGIQDAVIPKRPAMEDLRIGLWVATPIALAVGNVMLFLVGFVIGIVERPLAGTLIAFALSSWPLGMFAIWGIDYYLQQSGWPQKILVAVIVCMLNSGFLALTIYFLIGRVDFAVGFSIVNMIVVFVGGAFFKPSPRDPFFFELFEKPKNK